MKSYLNPTHGDDATARHGSKQFPWRTYAAAEAALKEARAAAIALDPQCDETFQLILTHKPPPSSSTLE